MSTGLLTKGLGYKNSLVTGGLGQFNFVKAERFFASTLHNTISMVGNRRRQGMVYIDLLYTGSAPIEVLEQVHINGKKIVPTTSKGYWQIQYLQPNSELQPLETVYCATEVLDDTISTYYFEIPSRTRWWLGDVIVDKPAWL